MSPRKARPLLDRIADRLALTDTGCLVWLGNLKRGYGTLTIRREVGRGPTTTVLIHRAVWESTIGPIPAGLQLDHLCRNRACARVDHLEPVTVQENLLRGNTIPAMWAARTSCNHGHEFTPENTGLRKGRWRYCLTCNRAKPRNRASRAKAKT